MKSGDINMRRAGSSCEPPCLLSCALGPLPGTQGPHQTAAFLICKCLIFKNNEAEVEFTRFSKSSVSTYHPHLTFWESNKNHHNYIHLSGQLVGMAEILGLFLLPFLLIWTDQPAWLPCSLGNIPLGSNMQDNPLEDELLPPESQCLASSSKHVPQQFSLAVWNTQGLRLKGNLGTEDSA